METISPFLRPRLLQVVLYLDQEVDYHFVLTCPQLVHHLLLLVFSM